MIGKSTLAWVGIILLGAIFVAVFANVLEMRLTKGDVYPHYATFRTDPLGSSGLYEAFGKIPGLSVEQNVESLMKVEGLDGETALFLLGVPRSQYPKLRVPDDSPVLEAVEKKGARLILTIDPQSVPGTHINTLSDDEEEWLEKRRRDREELREKVRDAREPNPDRIEKKDEKPKDKKETPEQTKAKIELDKIAEIGPRLEHRFGISIADVKKFDRPDEGWEAIPEVASLSAIPLWKSQYRFEFDSDSKDKWNVIATVEGEPVVAERKLGKGSIVLASDSYFASNEALFNGGDSEFLLWLTGNRNRLVFDETMHGTEEKIGAIKLLRQNRLHGVLVGILVFVALWAWKSAGSLAPGDEGVERGLIEPGGTVSGEDSKSGMVRLLQRSIPTKELIQNCLTTWKASQVTDLSAEKNRELGELLNSHQSDHRRISALSTYQKISHILKRR